MFIVAFTWYGTVDVSVAPMPILFHAKLMTRDLVNKVKIYLKRNSLSKMSSLGWHFLFLQSHFRYLEKQKQKKTHFIDRFFCIVHCLFIFRYRQRIQHYVLGKSQAEKFTSEWLSHLSSCDSEEEQMPHLDTGHIERIYIGVSRSVCSLSWAFEIFQRRWNEKCID